MTQAAVHPPTTLFAGDSWRIDAILIDSEELPLSLIDKTIEWTLYDQGALNRIITSAQVTVTVDDEAGGLCHIDVPADVTDALLPGRYFDALRVTDTSSPQTFGPQTFWTGVIYVQATGFSGVSSP